MMKKLFLFVIGFVMFKMGYSQYPIQQFIGADSAVVTSKGGLQGRLINQVFADTAAANSQRIRQYPGAMIYAGGKMWVRNTTATGWVELAYGPITVNNIYNSDGTLTGNRQLLGNNTYSLEFNQLPTFDLRTNTYTSLRTGNQNITLRGDTAAIFRRLSYNSNISSSFTPYSLVDKNYVDSSILSVPSTNIYNSDGTLTGNRELDADGKTLTFTAVRNFSLSADSVYYLLDPAGNLRLKVGNQQFTMQGDTASLSRRLSYTGNLGSSFTKHSLIDKNYVDSVASLAAGTVTSVATNNGTGITGGTITSTGTLAIDTLLISTRAWRQKGIDSVASLPRVTSVATNTGTGITGGTITSTGTLAIDTLLISTRAWRQKGIDSVTSLINARPSGSGTTNYLSKWTSSSALGNSLIFDNSTLGNVGINTASPASTLEIFKSTGTNYLYVTNGTSGTLNGVVLRWNSVDYMGMIGNFNSGEFKVGGFNAGGYFMTFYSNNAERMRLTPSGRLLIGTSTESTFLLDVSGTFRSTGDANINGLTVGKGGGSVAENTAFGVNALVSNTTGSAVTAVGYLAGNANGTSNHNTYIGTRTGISATGANNTFVGSLAGFSNTTGNLNTFLGNFAGYEVTTGTNNTFVGYYVGSGITTGTYNTMIGKSTVGNGITTGSFNTIIGSQITGLSASLSNTIILADGQGNQRLYINSSGRVGIGTTNPDAVLEVKGPSSSPNNAMYITTNTWTLLSAGSAVRIGTGATSGNTYGVIDVLQTGGLTAGGALSIAPQGGNVLIGTTTDGGFRLDVNGTARVSGTELRLDNGTTGVINLYSTTPEIRFAAGDPTGYRIYRSATGMFWNSANITLQISGNDAYRLSAANGHIWLNPNISGSALARLTTAGRLLIGTTTESTYLLDVFGTARIQSNSGLSLLVGNTSPAGTATPAVLSLGATFGTTAGSSSNVKLRVYDDGGSSTIYGIGISATLLEIQSNENIGFFNGNSVTRTERMRITTSGNVGIGTTSPNASALLDISSTTRGFLPPRMTNAQMTAIATPASGLMVYDTTNNKLNYYNGTSWVAL